MIVTKSAGGQGLPVRPGATTIAFNVRVKAQAIHNVIAQTKTGSGFWGAGEHELFGSNN
jgi:hypothetical protein